MIRPASIAATVLNFLARLIMKLISLPTAKACKAFFTIGKHYDIKGEIGNGYVVLDDKGALTIVLKERFE